MIGLEFQQLFITIKSSRLITPESELCDKPKEIVFDKSRLMRKAMAKVDEKAIAILERERKLLPSCLYQFVQK